MTSLPSVVAATVLTLAPLSAQPTPDFTGTWTMDRERSESPQQGDSFEPPTFVIVQTPTELTIETRRATAVSQARYPIAAATAAEQIGVRAGTRAYWQGASLVTEGTRIVQGQTVSVRETRSLDPSGAEMTVESLLVVQHGYTFKGAQNYGTAKDVYRRVGAPQDHALTRR